MQQRVLTVFMALSMLLVSTSGCIGLLQSREYIKCGHKVLPQALIYIFAVLLHTSGSIHPSLFPQKKKKKRIKIALILLFDF